MDLTTALTRILDGFFRTFGVGSAPRVALAPGRVNLIGEHTDYNGGLVLPMAIDRHTAVAFRPNQSAVFNIFAEGLGESDRFVVTGIQRDARPERQWTNYIRGTAWALAEKGVSLKGGDLFISSDLPIGAGLSSSASIEISSGLAFLALAGETKMERQTLALCGQRAEHEFAGVRCGIMDQTVVACAKAGHALLLDCRSLAVTHVPIHVDGCSFALFDSGVRHKLASSEYNRRRAECERAAKQFGRATLRDATLDDMLANLGRLSASEEKRVRHVVSENLRVVQFAAAMERADTAAMGSLLKSSHISLAEDYEVSCDELDDIYLKLLQKNGHDALCLGARMTGGGFGGSVVALLKTEQFKACEYALGPLAPNGGMLLAPADGAKVVD
jgi:galactokinase